MAGTIEAATNAFERHAWTEVYECLIDTSETPTADDLERLAVAAYLLGEDRECCHAWERAYLAFLARDDPGGAARCAFWLALGLMVLHGRMARASGWLGRIRRLVDEAHVGEDALRYLHVPAGLQTMGAGDHAGAHALFVEAGQLAAQFGDKDVAALACLGQGQAAIASGDTATGMALLDEVMVSVTTGEVSPIPAGIVYCAVIETCMGAFDLRRAAEWTEALSGWCDAQPDLVPYRGACLVHRSQILQIHGAWGAATTMARRARERLEQPAYPMLGLAAYQCAELHRLRGEPEAAESAYRQANRCGYEPLPGLALLRLAEGDASNCVATIRRAVEAIPDPARRPAILAAHVDIMLAVGDVASAHVSAQELSMLASGIDALYVHAVAAHANGATVLAEGDASAALADLRRAWTAWQELEMPYEAARTRVQIGLSCRELGDADSAAMEFDAARETFGKLGATPDLVRLAELTGTSRRQPGVLTERECEILRLVAAGKTNREIGAHLVLSEHTIARHLQNIFAKLGLSSRAAATAYAYEQHLV
ncbi:LuxR C-terminal-related transcriptional regulator [Mycolicibacterium sp. XJ1819]